MRSTVGRYLERCWCSTAWYERDSSGISRQLSGGFESNIAMRLIRYSSRISITSVNFVPTYQNIQMRGFWEPDVCANKDKQVRLLSSWCKKKQWEILQFIYKQYLPFWVKNDVKHYCTVEYIISSLPEVSFSCLDWPNAAENHMYWSKTDKLDIFPSVVKQSRS